MEQYIVDAFTGEGFRGNPAAICVMSEWPDEQKMKDIAKVNNLSETAFIVKEKEGYHLRWFTPTCEVGLCGHATLASGFTILNHYDKNAESVEFNTIGGRLKVSRKEDLYEMLFPNIPLEKVEITAEMKEALGAQPIEAWMGKELDLICVFKDEKFVKNYIPNPEAMMHLPGRMVHITAPATTINSDTSAPYDCCSRCFGPKIGIIEDPVCGSAHCQIIPYWAKRLGKNIINAWEASERGGALQGEIIDENNILLRGKATLFALTII